MDLHRIEEVLLVAKRGSIKKAAEELGLSSATLSARIQKYEETLGVTLFLPNGRGIALTEEGIRFMGSAGKLLEDYYALKETLAAAQEHSYKTLRIAVSGLILPLFLGPFLDELNRRNPDVHLELLDDSRYSIAEGLTSGAVDIYFAPATRDFQLPGLEKQWVSTSNQYVLLPRSHPLAGRTSISIRELEGAVFIPYPATAETCIRSFQLHNLEHTGIHYSIYEADCSPLFYTLLVPIGKGLILLPTPIMDPPPNSTLVSVSDIPYPAATCFFYDPNTENKEALSFVKDYSAFVKEAQRHEHRPPL